MSPANEIGNTTEGAATSGEHWSAKYRRRLGIVDSSVEMVGSGRWQPPKHGEIKINFSALMPEPAPSSHRGGGRSSKDWGGIGAVARDSAGDLLAVTFGTVRIGDGDNLGLQLYALKAAANLAKKLKDKGKHDGPVVYESGHLLVTCCFYDRSEGYPEKFSLFFEHIDPEKMLEACMPEDLGNVDASCETLDGDRLRSLPRDILQIFEQDKINADLAARRN